MVTVNKADMSTEWTPELSIRQSRQYKLQHFIYMYNKVDRKTSSQKIQTNNHRHFGNLGLLSSVNYYTYVYARKYNSAYR